MRINRNEIPSLRRPTRDEQSFIAAAWKNGTNPEKLKSMRNGAIIFAAVMGLLRAIGGNGGLNLGAGIATGAVLLLIFAPFILQWNNQIQAINRRQEQLNAGHFLVTPAEGHTVARNLWNMHNVGFASVRLSNGAELGNRRQAEVPYREANRLRQAPHHCVSRNKRFSAYLIFVDGEDTAILIPAVTPEDTQILTDMLRKPYSNEL